MVGALNNNSNNQKLNRKIVSIHFPSTASATHSGEAASPGLLSFGQECGEII